MQKAASEMDIELDEDELYPLQYFVTLRRVHLWTVAGLPG